MDGGAPAKAYEDKTEVILIGTQQQLEKVKIAYLEIGQASVQICKFYRPQDDRTDKQDLSISLLSPA